MEHMSFYISILLLETYSKPVKGNTRIENPSPGGTISVKVNTNTNRQHYNTKWNNAILLITVCLKSNIFCNNEHNVLQVV